jgi:hypothetical protein
VSLYNRVELYFPQRHGRTAAAAAIKIQLIKVPPGLTCEYQSLGVCFNGSLTKARQRIWLQGRIRHPDQPDSEQQTVERCQTAYEGISQKSTKNAWRKAYLID